MLPNLYAFAFSISLFTILSPIITAFYVAFVKHLIKPLKVLIAISKSSLNGSSYDVTLERIKQKFFIT